MPAHHARAEPERSKALGRPVRGRRRDSGMANGVRHLVSKSHPVSLEAYDSDTDKRVRFMRAVADERTQRGKPDI